MENAYPLDQCGSCTHCGSSCSSYAESPVNDCPDYEMNIMTALADFKSADAIDIPPSEPEDRVNHPNHYTQGGIECIEAIKASMHPVGFQDYCKGNVMKYIWRFRDKNGLEDLKKARVYLNWMIESVEEFLKED